MSARLFVRRAQDRNGTAAKIGSLKKVRYKKSAMADEKISHTCPSGQRIVVAHGDITEERVDAIVNAANSALAHGGGVAWAIVKKGGAGIQAESAEWIAAHGKVPTGGVAMTGAGNLPCKAVIHAVGPVWNDNPHDADALLRSAVWNSLELAQRKNFARIALPALSSGIFGFPKDRCAQILLATASEFCERFPDSPLREIRFTLFDEPTLDAFLSEFQRCFPNPAQR